jgi:FkbM family methyltransferase
MQLLEFHGIDLIIDVGANIGQYGRELRNLGYKGRIISFEPLPNAFEELARIAGRDAAWLAFQEAIGDHDGDATLHVAANSVSSSLLPMLPAHLEAAPYSRFVSDIQVQMITIDEAIGRHVMANERVFVKVDAQGYESSVIAGALPSLDRIQGFQLELSLVPLYEGSATLSTLVSDVERLGFTLMSIEPGFSDQGSGRLLQADGLFFRASPGSADAGAWGRNTDEALVAR